LVRIWHCCQNREAAKRSADDENGVLARLYQGSLWRDEAVIGKVANVTRRRVALQVIESVKPGGMLYPKGLAELLGRIGEMVRECER
jgi:hypothetical protein